MNSLREIAASGLLCLTLVAGMGWRSAAAAPQTQAPAAGEADPIARGLYLARAGDCQSCHTLPGQPAYSGGRAVPTPFGAVDAPNLTPDRETGLGTWTSEEFWHAMHDGVSRNGRLLYPAFPYPSFTLITRRDTDALFAYLQSLPPVQHKPTPSTLRFPYNTQLALWAWRTLFFHPQNFQADKSKSAQWNRGAYLAAGLGHCAACHSPRGAMGQISPGTAYNGGHIAGLGWDAPSLRFDPPMSQADAAAMAKLLKTGVSGGKAVVGPMAEVVHGSLQYLKDDDIAAIVTYLRSLPWQRSAHYKHAFLTGKRIYVKHCAQCHGDDGAGQPDTYPALAGDRIVTAASATNVIRVVIDGGYPPSTAGNPRPYGMPPYASKLDNAQIAAVLTYIRNDWGNRAPEVSAAEVGAH